MGSPTQDRFSQGLRRRPSLRKMISGVCSTTPEAAGAALPAGENLASPLRRACDPPTHL